MRTPSVRGIDVLRAFDRMLPGDSWGNWRTFVKACFALPMMAPERTVFEACTGRRTPPTARAKRIVGVIGRRGGKTRVIGWLGTYVAAFLDHSRVLAPGEVGVVAVMAPGKTQAAIIKSYVEAFFDAEDVLRRLVVRRTADALDITGQGGTLIRILVVAANYKLSRGHTLVAFIGDESSFWETESTAASPDVEIYRAILPALATTGGPAILISSPYAPTGLVYDLHAKHWGQDGDVLVWQADSLTMNPLLDEQLIAQAYQDDPESASAEYGAQFRSDLRSLFTPDALHACVVPGRRELPPQSGTPYAAFADPSGGSVDAFGLAIAHKDPFGLVVVDVVREWPSPFDPAAVVAECAELLRRYGCGSVSGDKYAGEWVAASFRQHGIEYRHAERTKSELFLDMLPLVNARQVQLLDQGRVLQQFVGLQRRTGSSGKDSIDHRRGAHDDLCNAVAGACALATQGNGRLQVPEAFRACNRELSGLPALAGGGCYLLGGAGRPPGDICCTGCVGHAFVRAARAAHAEQSGQTVDLLPFFRDRVQLPEWMAYRLLVRDAERALMLD